MGGGIGGALTTGATALGGLPIPVIGAPLAFLGGLGTALGFGADQVGNPLVGWPYAPGRVLWGLPLMAEDEEHLRDSLAAGTLAGARPAFFLEEWERRGRNVNRFLAGTIGLDGFDHGSTRRRFIREVRATSRSSPIEFQLGAVPKRPWGQVAMAEDKLGAWIERMVAHAQAHVGPPVFPYLELPEGRPIPFASWARDYYHDNAAPPHGVRFPNAVRLLIPSSAPDFPTFMAARGAEVRAAYDTWTAQQLARYDAELAKWEARQVAIALEAAREEAARQARAAFDRFVMQQASLVQTGSQPLQSAAPIPTSTGSVSLAPGSGEPAAPATPVVQTSRGGGTTAHVGGGATPAGPPVVAPLDQLIPAAEDRAAAGGLMAAAGLILLLLAVS